MLDFLFGRRRAPRAIVIDGRETPIEARGGETILEAALRVGVRLPNDCRVGGCGTCKCRLVEGEVHERTDKAYVLSKQELDAGYVLACQSVPRSDVRIAVPTLEADGVAHPVIATEGVVTARRVLTHDIVELHVQVEQPVVYTAGQYARISVPDVADVSRCYSFARAPRSEGDDTLVFYVREVPGGALSPRLVRGREPLRVRVEGPLGDFRLREGATPILAIAGGSGLAPLVAMLSDAARHKSARPITVLFGARTEADLYALDVLGALARSALAPFTFVPVLSHEPASSTWRGARGLVTSAIAAHVDPTAQAYLCGPPGMIDACVSELARFGLREDRVFADAFTDQSHLARSVA